MSTGPDITIFYAFRQSETETVSGTNSTGWETFLEAVLNAGLNVSGTWPVRTEYTSNLKTQRNALSFVNSTRLPAAGKRHGHGLAAAVRADAQ